MIVQTKDRYISPECEVLEIDSEGVIAASDPKASDGEVPGMKHGWDLDF